LWMRDMAFSLPRVGRFAPFVTARLNSPDDEKGQTHSRVH